MSTDLKGTTNHHLTRFWGGDQRGRSLQITAREFSFDRNKPGFITLDKTEALELAEALIQFVNDTRPEEEI